MKTLMRPRDRQAPGNLVRLTLALATALIPWAAASASPQSTGPQPTSKTAPQTDANSPSGATGRPEAGSQAKQSKIELLDLAPPNTEAAARRAGAALAARKAEEKNSPADAANQGGQPGHKDDAKAGQAAGAPPDAGSVTELHAASPGSQSAAGSKDGSGTHKQGGAKVHGSVYGSADPKHPGTRKDGAEVGVTSKSGKTSVFVGTGQTRGAPPQ